MLSALKIQEVVEEERASGVQGLGFRGGLVGVKALGP